MTTPGKNPIILLSKETNPEINLLSKFIVTKETIMETGKKVPTSVRVEAQARGLSLTGDSNVIDNVEVFRTNQKCWIGFDYKHSKYVILPD